MGQIKIESALHNQVYCVVNDRKHATSQHDRFDSENALYKYKILY